mgnify:CR=1 FL=1
MSLVNLDNSISGDFNKLIESRKYEYDGTRKIKHYSYFDYVTIHNLYIREYIKKSIYFDEYYSIIELIQRLKNKNCRKIYSLNDYFGTRCFDSDGFNEFGYDRMGYDRDGFNINGRDRTGVYSIEKIKEKIYFEVVGFSRSDPNIRIVPMNMKIYECQNMVFLKDVVYSCDISSIKYTVEGYFQNIFNREFTKFKKKNRKIYGYDGCGFDIDGYNREGYDRQGYDRDGFNYEGYDRQGYNRLGLTSLLDGYSREDKYRRLDEKVDILTECFQRAGLPHLLLARHIVFDHFR